MKLGPMPITIAIGGKTPDTLKSFIIFENFFVARRAFIDQFSIPLIFIALGFSGFNFVSGTTENFVNDCPIPRSHWLGTRPL
jgi:hypothetical protein